MLLGAALMKLGIFTAARPAAFYLRMALISYAIGLPLVTLAVYLQLHTNFDVVVLFGRTFIINAFASIFVSLGHVALLLWIYKHQWLPSITTRLAAVGRMALTNYLMHSVLCTILFYPYGFGLFGLLDKFQLFGVVLAIWILQLWYSPLWLRHFRFGPAEWLWRSLSYGRRQPLLQRPQMEQQAIA
jgi:uncharacterized protein